MKAHILTPWTGEGTTGKPNRPLVADAYKLQTWSDVTAQPCANLPPNPNLYAIEADLTSTELAKIEADPRFYVVWSDSKSKSAQPNATEYQTLITYLKAQTFTQTTLDAALGTTVANRTRQVIASNLVTELKKSTKT